jgi:hypothetical protein
MDRSLPIPRWYYAVQALHGRVRTHDAFDLILFLHSCSNLARPLPRVGVLRLSNRPLFQKKLANQNR